MSTATKFMKKGSVVLGEDKKGKPKFATVGNATDATQKKILKGANVAEKKESKATKKGAKAAKVPKGDDSRKITLLSKENPKREGSKAFKTFELYKKSKTVQDFLKAGGSTADIRYDSTNGHIKVA